MCDLCLASSRRKCDERMHFKNFGPSKAWPLTSISHQAYLAMPGPHSVWKCIPGWTLETCAFDFMHNVYLGHGRDLVGSSLKALIQRSVYDHVEYGNLDELLAYIQQEMIKDCSDCGFLVSEIVWLFFICGAIINSVSTTPFLSNNGYRLGCLG